MTDKTKKTGKVVVAHQNDGNGVHAVAAQLRVLISEDADAGFVAQGLEVDYCSAGRTIEEAQENFAKGFLMTVQSLIRRKRPLSALFKSTTPPDVWQEYIDSSRRDQLTCATIVDLSQSIPQAAGVPYSQLAFCGPRPQ